MEKVWINWRLWRKGGRSGGVGLSGYERRVGEGEVRMGGGWRLWNNNVNRRKMK